MEIARQFEIPNVTYDVAEGDYTVSGLGSFARVVIGVVVATVAFGWAVFSAVKSADRSARDPSYNRRRLIWLGVAYGFGATLLIAGVADGRAPTFTLVGLLIPILLVWWLARSANRIRTRVE